MFCQEFYMRTAGVQKRVLAAVTSKTSIGRALKRPMYLANGWGVAARAQGLLIRQWLLSMQQHTGLPKSIASML